MASAAIIMSGCCMPGWLARRLVVGVCCVGRDAAGHWRLYGGAAGRVRTRGMAAKRGTEGLSPAGPGRNRKRACGAAPQTLEFIPISQTPPRTPSPCSSSGDSLDLGDFIVIDTNPTPVPDAPVPPSWRRNTPEVLEVKGRPASPSSPRDADIAVVYEGPKRGRAATGVSPQVTPRRGCHTRARRGLKTQAPAAPALAAPDDDDDEEDVVVLAEVAPGTQEVEVIDVDSVGEGEGEGEDGEDSDGDSDCSRAGIVADDFSDDGGDGLQAADRGVEVRRDGFVPLGSVGLGSLENTSIDVPDEVLQRRRQLEAVRAWEETGLGREVEARGMRRDAVPLTVLSYNVLAQSLLRGNAGLYRDCDETHLTWEYRWALLQHEVAGLEPDVLLLQEVEAAHYHSHYLPWLAARGYRGLYKKRTGTKADGCAIFYRRAAWRLAEHRTVEYFQPRAPEVLDRDNVGLIARLVPWQGSGARGPGVVVATTHLLYNPRRHDVKLAQAAVMMAELDRICYQRTEAGQPQYCPMLLAGDLNAEPHSALLTFLQDGRLQYEGLGQRTLTRHSTGTTLGPALLPPALGITAACQHSALAQGRWLEGQRGSLFSPEDRRRLEEALIHLHHSDRPDAPAAAAAAAAADPLQVPGWLTHGFLLASVYRGRRRGREAAPEVTTFQERWCCVDYMLYSRRRHADGTPIEGRLKLLARLALPSARQARDYGPMPSDVCPSDHFPLAAKFMLTAS